MINDGLTPEELQAESAIALPDKEVVSILDLNVDVDVFLDAASPIDLAAAAQLNVAAPIEAAAGANVLAVDSTQTPRSPGHSSVKTWRDARNPTRTATSTRPTRPTTIPPAAARRWRHRGGRKPGDPRGPAAQRGCQRRCRRRPRGSDRRCRGRQRQRGRADQRQRCRQRRLDGLHANAISIQDAIITQELEGTPPPRRCRTRRSTRAPRRLTPVAPPQRQPKPRSEHARRRQR